MSLIELRDRMINYANSVGENIDTLTDISSDDLLDDCELITKLFKVAFQLMNPDFVEDLLELEDSIGIEAAIDEYDLYHAIDFYLLANTTTFISEEDMILTIDTFLNYNTVEFFSIYRHGLYDVCIKYKWFKALFNFIISSANINDAYENNCLNLVALSDAEFDQLVSTGYFEYFGLSEDERHNQVCDTLINTYLTQSADNLARTQKLNSLGLVKK